MLFTIIVSFSVHVHKVHTRASAQLWVRTQRKGSACDILRGLWGSVPVTCGGGGGYLAPAWLADCHGYLRGSQHAQWPVLLYLSK